MSDQTGEPVAWLSLSQYEVHAADLETTGDDWDAVIPAGVDTQINPVIQDLLPRAGWREVTVREPVDRPHPRRWFAAPRDNGWALVYLTPEPEGAPSLGAWPGPYRLRPSIADRNRGLRLEWSGPHRVAATDLTTATVSLVNDSESQWVWDPEDRGFVVGWLFDSQGGQSGPRYFAYGAYQFPLRDLGPGETMELAVELGPDVHQTAPGTYGVEAVMSSLRLRSERVSIEVV